MFHKKNVRFSNISSGPRNGTSVQYELNTSNSSKNIEIRNLTINKYDKFQAGFSGTMSQTIGDR